MLEEPEHALLLGVRVNLKWLTLFTMVFQNTLLVLMMRYSRKPPSAAAEEMEVGKIYLTSTAVVMAESFKMIIALVGVWMQSRNTSAYIQTLHDEIYHPDTLKLAVPGLLYMIQNNLLFIALSHLEAAVYQVTYQLKIITTAFFSVVMLGKVITVTQAISLLILTFGVAAVQLSAARVGETDEHENSLIGLAAVLLACCSSGFAGVYFEKILKQGRKVSLFMRNIQLSMFGIILGLLAVVLQDYQRIKEDGFFQGYNQVVWLTVLIQAGSGFVIASVMKYADNILKGFATAVSIILSSIISIFLFQFEITALFSMGVILVVGSVFLYGYKPATNILPKSLKRENT